MIVNVNEDGDVIMSRRPDYVPEVENLIAILEDEDIEVGFSDLGEVVIDYLLDELSHEDLVYRYKCNKGHATRLLMVLNKATGGNVPITGGE